MKKYFLTLIIAFLVIAGFNACSDDYLDVIPTNSVSDELVFNSIENAWGAINGMHRILYSQNAPLRSSGRSDEAGQHGMIIHMDMLGEDLVNHTRANGWFIATYQWNNHRNANGTLPFYAYRYYYRMISNANMIISRIDDVDGPSEDIEHIKGQAYAYRAWSHWMLVQLYSERYDAGKGINDQPGIPYMDDMVYEGKPRGTVEEVYEKALLDINMAIELLDGKPFRAKSHISHSIAQGMKARFALTMQNWEMAAQMANAARQGHVLMDQDRLLDGFNDFTNPEFMWASRQSGDQPLFFHSFYAFMSVNFNSGNIRQNPKKISERLYTKISDTDARRNWWVEDPTGIEGEIGAPGDVAPYMNQKFRVEDSGVSIGDLPHMRTAEMYLIEAEALARMGNYSSAAEVLHELVITRDSQYQLSANTGQALIDEILIHRRIELWGEGFRFLDLKRTNSALDRTNSNHNSALAVVLNVESGVSDWQFMIPQDEINANPYFTQDDQNF